MIKNRIHQNKIPARIKILESERSPQRDHNPYFTMLFDAIAKTDEPRWFTWRNALLGRYEIFHLHFPETFVASSSCFKVFIKRILLEGLILRLRISRIPLVWTVHHLEPYEKNNSGAEKARLRLEGLAIHKIYLHAGSGHDSSTATTIMIGEYRNWFERFVSTVPRNESMFLCFGLMRPYKNVEALVDIIKAGKNSAWKLVLAGRASPASYADSLRARIAGHQNIDDRFAYLSDADLVRLIQTSAVVVLPYREMYNSSAALTSLSLGTPVLVPANEANQRLQDEFGPEWVITYSAELSEADLAKALLTSTGSSENALPDLSKRSWSEIGQKHNRVFEQVLAGTAPISVDS
ncbi:glycosyltransferase [Cryobacterium lyxosi]|uniref:Glycosyltransferase n=1 Tax=Cryobacterium lyxosi TaxID=1259228 RepID=A0A4R8ZIT4_9MICO|nr:glycosyltransferase [Cryobacterium lyxosi]TFD29190.1 glycosyltransferase [Cryobacterium lyxosi]